MFLVTLEGPLAEKFLNRVLRESDAGHRSEPHSIPNTIGQAISAKLTLQYRSSEFSGNFSRRDSAAYLTIVAH